MNRPLDISGMNPSALVSLAGRINTGVGNADLSRALIVFNPSDQAQSGIAVFHAEMSWSSSQALPPVVIRDLDGSAIPSALTDLLEEPDTKGRADRRHLTFDLRFLVHDIPAHGWRTYLADYTERPVVNATEALREPNSHLIVVETLRHDGDLPPVGWPGIAGTF